MNFYEAFSMAMKNIRSSKTRSILTMLGIIIGVAAVIVITGLGSGMEKYMREQFESMGTCLLYTSRLCPGLLDGKDKEKFYIFDFCGNFEFFRMNKGRPTANMLALQGAIFQLEFEIAYKLQDIVYQTESLIAVSYTHLAESL